MRACAPAGAKTPPAVALAFVVDAKGGGELHILESSTAAECVARRVSTGPFAAPPFAPYHFLIDMTVKP